MGISQRLGTRSPKPGKWEFDPLSPCDRLSGLAANRAHVTAASSLVIDKTIA
jgi:hypothetical protein